MYSASELGGQELPDLDVALRGAVSLARRLQDPLAELVKVLADLFTVDNLTFQNLWFKQCSNCPSQPVFGCGFSCGLQ